MIAANNGHIKVVKFLADKNASIDEKNNDGDTALMYAERQGYEDIVELLRSESSQF